MSSRSKHRLIFAIIIAVLIVLVCFVVWYPAGEKEAPPAGYTPLRDDDLAARYRPVFDCPTEFGPILAVYYRAARDDSGLIHIAYHPLWAGERNDTKAFLAFLKQNFVHGRAVAAASYVRAWRYRDDRPRDRSGEREDRGGRV